MKPIKELPMNPSTLSQLPAEPVLMLGKSKRQIAEEAAAEAKRNAAPAGPPPMTSAPKGYELTPQGGLRRKDQPWVVPDTKGRALKLPRTLDELEATEWWDEGDNQDRLVALRGGCRCCVCPPCSACSEPITQDEAERLGLIEPVQRDDGPCGVVPSAADVRRAFFDADVRNQDPYLVVDRVLGYEWCGTFCNIPADRRADVIKALNALSA